MQDTFALVAWNQIHVFGLKMNSIVYICVGFFYGKAHSFVLSVISIINLTNLILNFVETCITRCMSSHCRLWNNLTKMV